MPYKPRFEMPEDSRGWRWHKETEEENPMLSFVAFSTAMSSILLVITMLGGSWNL